MSLELHLQECEPDDFYRHYQLIQKPGFEYSFCPVLFGLRCVVNCELFLISISFNDADFSAPSPLIAAKKAAKP